MSVTKRLRYLWNALRWALLSERDPFQVRIDACRAAMYTWARAARDAAIAKQREEFRTLAREELRQIEALELERLRVFVHATVGLVIAFFLVSWGVLSLLF